MEVPETMTAAYVDRLGPTNEIRLGRLPVPRPGPTDVLVRVEATAVNTVDTFVRSGRYRTPLPFPFVLGRDVVGTVAALGDDTTGVAALPFAVGDRVWCNSLGHAGRQGAASEYAVVAGDRLYSLSSGVDPATAVAVAHPAATACLALRTHAGLRAGEVVHVGGGGGNVGGAAIVLAARAGARVVATARDEDHERCRALGAAVVIDYRDPEAWRRMRDAAPGGVDVHLDTSGRQDLTAAVDTLASRGRIVVIAGPDDGAQMPIGPLYVRDGSVLGFAISNARVHELAAAAGRIGDLLAEGALAPRRLEERPLDAIAEVHEHLEAGGAHGTRYVLRP